MKRKLSIFLVLLLMLSLILPITVYAEGEGNIDNGGGGMGSGSNENYWNGGDEGVRITVVRANDRAAVTSPVDFTNRNPNNIQIHFGKNSKLDYSNGRSLTPNTNVYSYINPSKTMPKIISTSSGQASIEQIKSL